MSLPVISLALLKYLFISLLSFIASNNLVLNCSAKSLSNLDLLLVLLYLYTISNNSLSLYIA